MQKIEVDLEKEDSAENESFKPLTREEALKLSLRLKKNNPFLSVWRVLAGQCLVGCLVAAMAGFFFWEAIKIALTVAMLFAAPKLIASLSWLALVVGFVVTMKVVWVFMLIRPKHRQSDKI